MDLNALLALLGTISPQAAVIGAIVLFVVQLLGGNKFDLSGLLKNLFKKKDAPAVPDAPKADAPQFPLLNLILGPLLQKKIQAKIDGGKDEHAAALELAAEIDKPKV